MNTKLFKLRETFLVEHESCQCKCCLNESVCNSKQEWTHDE